MPQNKRTVLAILIFGFSLVLPAEAELKPGNKFPDLSTCGLEGDVPASIKDKVVLIDFWASWCIPCAQSFPTMEELQKTYGPEGFVIIAVNVDEKKSEMTHFLKEHHVSFIVVRDARQKLVDQTGISTMPSSFLIDRNGKVAFAHSGFHGSDTKKQYEREIKSLLKQANQ